MLSRSRNRLVLTLTILAVGEAAVAATATGQDLLSAFMQAKLAHAQKTLEGLARQDFAEIEKHSQAINLLCEDEKWAVVKSIDYFERSKEFQRSVYAITEAAREKNLEAATLAYVDTTLKCVSCHNYVRKVKAAK